MLLSLADFTFEFEHYDVGLNYTVWAVEAMEAYELLYDSLTPPERQKLDAFCQRFLAAVQKNDAYWVEHEPGGPLNNHYAWHKLAFVAVGLFTQQPAVVDQALDGPKGILMLMQHGFTDEGLWIEGSIPYQLAATTPLVRAAELLENADYPRKIYARESGDGHTFAARTTRCCRSCFPIGRCRPSVTVTDIGRRWASVPIGKSFVGDLAIRTMPGYCRACRHDRRTLC